jgi:hypothetical protein
MTRRILVYLIWLVIGFMVGFALAYSAHGYWQEHCWR